MITKQMEASLVWDEIYKRNVVRVNNLVPQGPGAVSFLPLPFLAVLGRGKSLGAHVSWEPQGNPTVSLIAGQTQPSPVRDPGLIFGNFL